MHTHTHHTVPQALSSEHKTVYVELMVYSYAKNHSLHFKDIEYHSYSKGSKDE